MPSTAKINVRCCVRSLTSAAMTALDFGAWTRGWNISATCAKHGWAIIGAQVDEGSSTGPKSGILRNRIAICNAPFSWSLLSSSVGASGQYSIVLHSFFSLFFAGNFSLFLLNYKITSYNLISSKERKYNCCMK